MPIHPQRTYDLTDEAVGAVLRQARAAVGMDLDAGAEASNVNRAVLSRIEIGDRPCRVPELDALSRAYGIASHVMMQAIAGDERAMSRVRRARRLAPESAPASASPRSAKKAPAKKAAAAAAVKKSAPVKAAKSPAKKAAPTAKKAIPAKAPRKAATKKTTGTTRSRTC
ncbi:helix-turn-helix transcriptional regulator [Mycolicibacterium fortuitum]|uniref:helix-turn-helix domain-containing protein n=1 Tax=Mycolicibacterium TaxID=1866885 RepID=UPI0032048867